MSSLPSAPALSPKEEATAASALLTSRAEMVDYLSTYSVVRVSSEKLDAMCLFNNQLVEELEERASSSTDLRLMKKNIDLVIEYHEAWLLSVALMLPPTKYAEAMQQTHRPVAAKLAGWLEGLGVSPNKILTTEQLIKGIKSGTQAAVIAYNRPTTVYLARALALAAANMHDGPSMLAGIQLAGVLTYMLRGKDFPNPFDPLCAEEHENAFYAAVRLAESAPTWQTASAIKL